MKQERDIHNVKKRFLSQSRRGMQYNEFNALLNSVSELTDF